MQFIFLRHAPTSWNENRLLQGTSDIPLSEKGRQVAGQKIIPPHLAESITACYTSPLIRAHETAEIICGSLNFPIIGDERLREMGFGVWEGQGLSDIRYRLRFVMERLEGRGREFAAPGGESPRDVGERLLDFFCDMWDVHGGEGVILCVAHKGVIRSLYSLAVGWDMVSEGVDRLDMDCLQVFNFDGENISVEKLNVPFHAR